MCASGRSPPLGTLPSPSIGFNLMTNFSRTRSMEFYQSDWFFTYQINEIPSIWLIFQVPDQWNSINLVIEISKRPASLLFEYELGWTAFLDSRKKQLKKYLSKNCFFLLENWHLSKNRPYRYISQNHIIRFRFTLIFPLPSSGA